MPHFLVIGLNTLGRTLARELVRRGAKVTAVDRDRDMTRRLMNEVDQILCFDAADRRALETLPIKTYDHVVVCMGHAFEAAERTTLALCELGAEAITNVATTSQRRDILEMIGAQRVMTPGLLQARNLAIELTEPAIAAFWHVGPDAGVAEVPLTGIATMGQLPASERVRCIGGRRSGHEDFVVGDGATFQAGDHLIVFGEPSEIVQWARRHVPTAT